MSLFLNMAQYMDFMGLHFYTENVFPFLFSPGQDGFSTFFRRNHLVGNKTSR